MIIRFTLPRCLIFVFQVVVIGGSVLDSVVSVKETSILVSSRFVLKALTLHRPVKVLGRSLAVGFLLTVNSLSRKYKRRSNIVLKKIAASICCGVRTAMCRFSSSGHEVSLTNDYCIRPVV
jgi:hypothetical protein